MCSSAMHIDPSTLDFFITTLESMISSLAKFQDHLEKNSAPGGLWEVKAPANAIHQVTMPTASERAEQIQNSKASLGACFDLASSIGAVEKDASYGGNYLIAFRESARVIRPLLVALGVHDDQLAATSSMTNHFLGQGIVPSKEEDKGGTLSHISNTINYLCDRNVIGNRSVVAGTSYTSFVCSNIGNQSMFPSSRGASSCVAFRDNNVSGSGFYFYVPYVGSMMRAIIFGKFNNAVLTNGMLFIEFFPWVVIFKYQTASRMRILCVDLLPSSLILLLRSFYNSSDAMVLEYGSNVPVSTMVSLFLLAAQFAGNLVVSSKSYDLIAGDAPNNVTISVMVRHQFFPCLHFRNRWCVAPNIYRGVTMSYCVFPILLHSFQETGANRDVPLVNAAMPCTESTTAMEGKHSVQGLVPSARVVVPLDYVSSSWVGTNIGHPLLEPQLQVEVAMSRLRYGIPASSVVSASTWPDLFTLAVWYTVCFDPGIPDSSGTSIVHYGSSNQSTRRTDVATTFQQAQQSLAEAFEVVPGLGKCPLQSTAIINGSWCHLHEIYSLAKAQSYASHCTKVVANCHKANLYVMHWDDIIVRHLEELFSEFDSDIILLLLQQNATQFFYLALNVDVPEFSLHAINFSTDASTKLPLKSDSEFRRWAPVLPYSFLNWKQSVRVVLCFDPGGCSDSFGYVLAFLAFTVRYLYVRALKVSVAILAAFFLSVLAVIRPFGSFHMSGTAHVLGASSALNGSIANSVSHRHALADVMFIFAQVKSLTDQLHMLVSTYKHHVAHPQASAWCATFCPGVEVATAIPGMASLGTGCLVSTTLIALVLRILCFDPGIGSYNCNGCHKYKMLVFSPLKDAGVLSSSPTLILVFSRILHW